MGQLPVYVESALPWMAWAAKQLLKSLEGQEHAGDASEAMAIASTDSIPLDASQLGMLNQCLRYADGYVVDQASNGNGASAAATLLSHDDFRVSLLHIVANAVRRPVIDPAGDNKAAETSALHGQLAFDASLTVNNLVLSTLLAGNSPFEVVVRFTQTLLRMHTLHCCSRQLNAAATAIFPAAGATSARELVSSQDRILGLSRSLQLSVQIMNPLVVLAAERGGKQHQQQPQPNGSVQQQPLNAKGLSYTHSYEYEYLCTMAEALSSSGLLEHAARAIALLAELAGVRDADLSTSTAAVQAAAVPHEALDQLSYSFSFLTATLLGLTQLAIRCKEAAEAAAAAVAATAAFPQPAPGPYSPMGSTAVAEAGAEAEALAAACSHIQAALSGPCVRHMLTSATLAALCAADGGPSYGLPPPLLLRLLPSISPVDATAVAAAAAAATVSSGSRYYDVRQLYGRRQLDDRALRCLPAVLSLLLPPEEEQLPPATPISNACNAQRSQRPRLDEMFRLVMRVGGLAVASARSWAGAEQEDIAEDTQGLQQRFQLPVLGQLVLAQHASSAVALTALSCAKRLLLAQIRSAASETAETVAASDSAACDSAASHSAASSTTATATAATAATRVPSPAAAAAVTTAAVSWWRLATCAVRHLPALASDEELDQLAKLLLDLGFQDPDSLAVRHQHQHDPGSRSDTDPSDPALEEDSASNPGTEMGGGFLPATPPPTVAAALAGGLIPCIERLLRRAGTAPQSPEARLLLRLLRPTAAVLCNSVHGTSDSGGSYGIGCGSYLGCLLSYGEPQQAAALVASLGKVLRRLQEAVVEEVAEAAAAAEADEGAAVAAEAEAWPWAAVAAAMGAEMAWPSATAAAAAAAAEEEAEDDLAGGDRAGSISGGSSGVTEVHSDAGGGGEGWSERGDGGADVGASNGGDADGYEAAEVMAAEASASAAAEAELAEAVIEAMYGMFLVCAGKWLVAGCTTAASASAPPVSYMPASPSSLPSSSSPSAWQQEEEHEEHEEHEEAAGTWQSLQRDVEEQEDESGHHHHHHHHQQQQQHGLVQLDTWTDESIGPFRNAAVWQLAVLVSYAACEWLPQLSLLTQLAAAEVVAAEEACQQQQQPLPLYWRLAACGWRRGGPAGGSYPCGLPLTELVDRLVLPLLSWLPALGHQAAGGGGSSGGGGGPAGGGATAAAAAAGDGGGDCSPWLQLLREVGAVPLLGAVLRLAAPLAEVWGGGGWLGMPLWSLAESCHWVAAASPEDVRQYGSWPPELLCALVPYLRGRGHLWDETAAATEALAARLEAWEAVGGGGGGSAAVLATHGGTRDVSYLAASSQVLSALPEARRLLRTCGNAACVNLEGESEAGQRLRPCSGGCGTAWYCGTACRVAALRAGHGAECGRLARARRRIAQMAISDQLSG